MNHQDFAIAVLVYCYIMGASETQGRRTPARNAREKGVAHSPHLAGFGRDVSYDSLPAEALATEWAKRLGLRLKREEDHDHLQPLTWPPG